MRLLSVGRSRAFLWTFVASLLIAVLGTSAGDGEGIVAELSPVQGSDSSRSRAVQNPEGQDSLGQVVEVRMERFRSYYMLVVPPGYSRTRPTPLIVDLHGASHPSTRPAERSIKAWRQVAAERGYLHLLPQARLRAWNVARKGYKEEFAAGGAAGTDTEFVLAAIESVSRVYNVDRNRILLTGFSSGADFVYQLVETENSRQFKAAIPICAGVFEWPEAAAQREVKPIPILNVTGELDVRKPTVWKAFRTLKKNGWDASFVEVPAIGHRFPPSSYYAQFLDWFEALDQQPRTARQLKKMIQDSENSGDIAEAISLCRKLLTLKISKRDREETLQRLAEYEAKGQVAMEESERVYSQGGKDFQNYLTGLASMWKAMVTFWDTPVGTVAEERYNQWAQSPEVKAAREQERQKRKKERVQQRMEQLPWSRYLTYPELRKALDLLASKFPDFCKLHTMGRSVQGREILALEITNTSVGKSAHKPAIYIQGNLHGNEINTSLFPIYLAWFLLNQQGKSPQMAGLLRDVVFYLAPTVNPDAGHSFLTEPHSHWRPRFNMQPYDADGDGLVDEDPYEDLNGDGEIGHMYQPDPQGKYVLTAEGYFKRAKAADEGKRWRLVGREGMDNDGDGRFSEDPPGGVNLNRNFPVGFSSRHEFEGFRGPEPLSEPETQAIAEFVREHPNISVFVDFHNNGSCVFYRLRSVADDGKTILPELAEDANIYGELLEDAPYRPRLVAHRGVGLSISWAYDMQGLFSFIVELGKEGCETKRLKPTPFHHPQLGDIYIGNDYPKLYRRNPRPEFLEMQLRRSLGWILRLARALPRLAILDSVIVSEDQAASVHYGDGRITVLVEQGTTPRFNLDVTIANLGRIPTITQQAVLTKSFEPDLLSIDFGPGLYSLAASGNGNAKHVEIKLDSFRSYERRRLKCPFEYRGNGSYSRITLTLRSTKGGKVQRRISLDIVPSNLQ